MISKGLLGNLFVLFFNYSAWSAVILVSDIDDTIKRTNVRSQAGLLTNGIQSKNAFYGMNILFDHFLERDRNVAIRSSETLEEGESGRTGSAGGGGWQIMGTERTLDSVRTLDSGVHVIKYLTAAPSFLSIFGRNFLKDSLFPTGEVLDGRHIGENKKEFKKRKLFETLGVNSQYDVYILVGDNGEMDPQAYSEWAKESNLQKTTEIFIHHVYSERPTENTIEFLTAADLAIYFYNKGWINELNLIFILEQMDFQLRNPINNETIIPKFMNCRDFYTDQPNRKFIWPIINSGSVPNKEQHYLEILSKGIESKVEEICGS